MANIEVRAIGRVESALTDLDAAPRQADEGAPEAWRRAGSCWRNSAESERVVRRAMQSDWRGGIDIVVSKPGPGRPR